MKKFFESWKKNINDSKVINLNRYAFNQASEQLYNWFEEIAYHDLSLDAALENYDELVQERAEYFKYAFLGAIEAISIESALETIGIPVKFLGTDMFNELLTIVKTYNKRKSLL